MLVVVGSTIGRWHRSINLSLCSKLLSPVQRPRVANRPLLKLSSPVLSSADEEYDRPDYIDVVQWLVSIGSVAVQLGWRFLPVVFGAVSWRLERV